MSKHTPGPWELHHNIGRKGEIGIVADAAPCIIAVMGNQNAWPAEARANAEFIVRACNAHDELLAALELAMECMPDPDYRGTTEAQRAAHASMSAAIRKAKGGA